MRRREFIAMLGGAAAAWPVVADGQQTQKMKRVAMFTPGKIETDPSFTIVLDEMKRLGFVEGKNLIVDRYSAESQFDRLPEFAKDIVATKPDVIYSLSTKMAVLLQSETRTIPVVAWMTDPVAAGVALSLARPGGNTTGVSVDAGAQMGAKYIQLLSEAVGRLSNVRLLATASNWETATTKVMRDTAEAMNIPLRLQPLQSPVDEKEYRRAFEAMRRDQVDGIVISSEAEHIGKGPILGPLTLEYRIPSIGVFTGTVEAGGLMCYSWNGPGMAPHAAAQIVEILNGAKPGEIPFFQETRWTLIINLKAAKELGLELPAGLIARAERFIE